MPRYFVGFSVVRLNQAHPQQLFKTDCPAVAASWLHIGFTVFDSVASQQCHIIEDIEFYQALHQQ